MLFPLNIFFQLGNFQGTEPRISCHNHDFLKPHANKIAISVKHCFSSHIYVQFILHQSSLEN